MCSTTDESLTLYPQTSYFPLNLGFDTDSNLGTITAFPMFSLRTNTAQSRIVAYYEKSNLVLYRLDFYNLTANLPLLQQLHLLVQGFYGSFVLESTNLHINKFINKDAMMFLTWMADLSILAALLIVYFKNLRNKAIEENNQRKQLKRVIKEKF